MDNLNGEMYSLAADLFPICRSLTGEGVRKTLQVLQENCNILEVQEIASGTPVFDWTVPAEWNVREAYIENENGTRIVDFKDNNLHVVGYSCPIDKWVTLEELKEYIHTQPDQPDVIPYVTSYYSPRSGFCMSESMKNSLINGKYHIYIDSEFTDNVMNWGEIVIPGDTEEEVFFSTNICHPSLANNEISGPVVLVFLANWLRELQHRRYTYRLLFIPETIGSITYIAQNLTNMQKYIKAGFVVTCVGDNKEYSYVSSPTGENYADRVLTQVLKFHAPDYKKYSFLLRGSDERQYCAPGVDLPFCTFCRSKFHEYKEYHTSADNMSFISEEGMRGALEVLQKCVWLLEADGRYKNMVLCEPQLGKRGLYPTVSQKGNYSSVKIYQNILAYADGKRDLIDLSEILGIAPDDLIEAVHRLTEQKLLGNER